MIESKRTDCWKFRSRCAYHTQVPYFASSSEVKHRESHDPNFLVGTGTTAMDEAGCVLASADLCIVSISNNGKNQGRFIPSTL